MSLKSYLTTLKSLLGSNKVPGPLTFVTGNQSADLDSVISALTYSRLSNLKNSTYTIPLINIPKDDFKLRRDIVSLLKSYSIDESLLFFVEDFEKLNNGKTNIILVDHCNIQGDILHLYEKRGLLDVISIIDHHDDEGVFLNANPRIIQTNGSCSSLVFNYWYGQLGEDTFKESPELVKLLLAPLLIDTTNMTAKVQQPDTDAFKVYREILGSNDFVTLLVGFNTSEVQSDLYHSFYKYLKTNKKDLSGFNFQDVLHKDYKQFDFANDYKVGFSSIGKSLNWVFKTYEKEVEKTLSAELKNLGLNLLVITSSYTQNDQYTREFAYYYEDFKNERLNNLHDLVGKQLQLNDNVYKLGKVDKKVGNGVLKVYNQVNLGASRKQVVPYVKEVLEA